MDRRALWIILFLSLALNVFVAGAFVGARLGRGPAEASEIGPGPRPRNAVLLAVRTLSPESQAAWREQGAALVPAGGPRTREARRLAREAIAGLGQPDFQAEAALASLARARALEYEHRVAMDRRLVAFAASLPPAERAKFAEALARPMDRRAR